MNTGQVPQTYQIQLTGDFYHQALLVPKKIAEKLPKKWKNLENTPRYGANIKKIKNSPRGSYRLRIGDYRVIYIVNDNPREVLLRYFKKRDESTYDRIIFSKTQPVVDVKDHASANNPSPESSSKGKPPTSTFPQHPHRLPSDHPLPEDFRSHVEDMEIPEPHRSALLKCRTEKELGELFDELPDGLSDRILGVLEKLWPSPLNELLDVPKRVVDSPEDLLAAVDGSRTLESFLLVLDKKQKPLVASFQKHPNGPWLVKGGPGTGKSTVALYCIRSLLRPDRSTSSIVREPLRILFTAFTKSLVAVSAHLLESLECDASDIEIVNVDELAWRHRAPDWVSRTFGSDGQWESIAKSAIDQVAAKHTPFAFGERDLKFLFDEANQVILGNQITSLEEYKGFSRVGRGRRLGRKQREQVWAFFEVVDREANRLRRGLPGHIFGSALERARPIYDYVFIDEAQDLLPVAIRMCVAFAKDKRNVFLTADKNQSIYTSGFSWKNVEDSLDFRGRTRILRRNYRTTREIMNGLRPLLRDDEETDEETRVSKCLRKGPSPELRWGSKASEGRIAGQWVKDICQKENLGNGNVAVLCPTNRDCRRLAQELQCLGLKAIAMRRDDVDLSFDGIKVLTMHSAKGLEFPIVAVVGLARGRMPWTDPTDPAQRGETDKLQRTFFVACSRAMRRLLVVADQDSPSPFVSGFDRKYWETPE